MRPHLTVVIYDDTAQNDGKLSVKIKGKYEQGRYAGNFTGEVSKTVKVMK